MLKGYWIATADITNMDGYRAYMEANGAAFRKYGGKFLVRGGKSEAAEGKLRARVVAPRGFTSRAIAPSRSGTSRSGRSRRRSRSPSARW